MITILIVDDDAMVRTGLRMIIGGDHELDVVAEAEDGSEVAALVAEHHPDLVLMDIRMPGQDGLTTTEQLMALSSPPHVLVLTTFDADDHVLRALRAGAAGFLLKDTAPVTMIEAIKRVVAGEPVLSPSVTARVIDAVTRLAPASDQRSRERLADLTDREREVAIEVGRGRSNAEIATELYLSVATVKANMTRIFTKLDTDSRVQVALLIRDAGLV